MCSSDLTIRAPPIAAAHGGRVWAGVSAKGGARIVLELPGFRLAKDAAVAARPSRSPPLSDAAPPGPGDGAVRPDAVASP